MPSLLVAKKINKEYVLAKNNINQVLKNVSLTIEKGEFVSIMGPSGSGKSTLLYNISGMDKPTSGSIDFDNSDIGAISEKQMANLRLKKMGFIFQQNNLLKNLSILDNIIVSAYLSGLEKKSSINKRALSLMEQTGIIHLKDNDITQASGGELQRASICRALINQPMILFGDEPTGSLNSSATKEVMYILSDIHKAGTTILLVTHDAKVATCSERVLFMMDGQIKGECYLGKYEISEDNIKSREEKLLKWLSNMGF